jgi:hypothetical protein
MVWGGLCSRKQRPQHEQTVAGRIIFKRLRWRRLRILLYNIASQYFFKAPKLKEGFGLGCAVRFRFEAKQSENEAKNFSLRSEKKSFFSCFASKRNTGNYKRNENGRSETTKAKRN